MEVVEAVVIGLWATTAGDDRESLSMPCAMPFAAVLPLPSTLLLFPWALFLEYDDGGVTDGGVLTVGDALEGGTG